MKDIAKFIADAEAAIANIKAALLGSEDENPMSMPEDAYQRRKKRQIEKQQSE